MVYNVIRKKKCSGYIEGVIVMKRRNSVRIFIATMFGLLVLAGIGGMLTSYSFKCLRSGCYNERLVGSNYCYLHDKSASKKQSSSSSSVSSTSAPSSTSNSTSSGKTSSSSSSSSGKTSSTSSSTSSSQTSSSRKTSSASSSKSSSSKKYSDPYDVYSYTDPDDFSYDYEDEFGSYEDAEDYYYDAWD